MKAVFGVVSMPVISPEVTHESTCMSVFYNIQQTKVAARPLQHHSKLMTCRQEDVLALEPFDGDNRTRELASRREVYLIDFVRIIVVGHCEDYRCRSTVV